MTGGAVPLGGSGIGAVPLGGSGIGAVPLGGSGIGAVPLGGNGIGIEVLAGGRIGIVALGATGIVELIGGGKIGTVVLGFGAPGIVPLKPQFGFSQVLSVWTYLILPFSTLNVWLSGAGSGLKASKPGKPR
jgi:hypothetical protein